MEWNRDLSDFLKRRRRGKIVILIFLRQFYPYWMKKEEIGNRTRKLKAEAIACDSSTSSVTWKAKEAPRPFLMSHDTKATSLLRRKRITASQRLFQFQFTFLSVFFLVSSAHFNPTTIRHHKLYINFVWEDMAKRTASNSNSNSLKFVKSNDFFSISAESMGWSPIRVWDLIFALH
jgi:hypothetical protein